MSDWQSIDFKKKGSLFLVPLGGVGEIGMNLMVMIWDGRGVLIDCGVMFPDAGMLGVDLIVPNIEFLKESKIKIEGIVLTHGHEDHIGATAFLYEDLKCPPIYGSNFTLALVEDRMREHGNLSSASLRRIQKNKKFRVGPFQFEPLQVTHSIAESMGLAIETPIGKIIHSGDFKIDRKPVDGQRFDEARFRKFSKENVLLLMSDSTNSEREGWSISENEVSVGLRKLIKSITKGKIVVAVFASNVHRVHQIIKAANEAGRRVALCGRSMHSNFEVSQKLGLFKIHPGQMIPNEMVMDADPDKVLIISTGTQAEPRSALYRMSLNDHPEIKLEEGDTIIMSSRHIPGNEKNISHLVNNLYRRGATVIDSHSAPIHASGHAHQEEQLALLKWIRPKFFFPVHGEYRMLVKHQQLAMALTKQVRTLVGENGDVLELTKSDFRKIGRVPSGKIYLDEAAGDLHEELLRDRKQLAHSGLVVVSCVVETEDATIIEGPDFDIRGVNDEVDLDALKAQLVARFKELSTEARKDSLELNEEFRRVTRRFFHRANGVKPVVIPLIYEV